MRRPFSVTFGRDAAPGIMELTLVFQDPLLAQHQLGWQDVLKTFVDLANCGAISGSGISPDDSGCVVELAHFDRRDVHWRLKQTKVDRAASTVLLNLCHWGHLNVSKLEKFVLDWEGCPDESHGERLWFPGAWPRPSFALTEYELVGQTTAIDVDFQSPHSFEKREEINDSIGYWFKAANWGGYADDQFPLPGSTVLIAPQVMTTDALGVTWYLEAFHCSDRVFDGLINCLQRVSLTQAPIRRVTIGE